MKITIGLILGLLIGYITSVVAADAIRRYQCADAVWAGTIDVTPDMGQPFTGQFGFCSDGLVLWRKYGVN